MVKQVLTPYKFNQDKLAQDILSRLNREGQLAMCKVFIQLENAMTQDQNRNNRLIHNTDTSKRYNK